MSNPKEPKNQMQNMPIFLCLGVSVGMAIGAALDNIGVGMCVGMSVGMCLGVCLDSIQKKKAEKEPENGEEE